MSIPTDNPDGSMRRIEAPSALTAPSALMRRTPFPIDPEHAPLNSLSAVKSIAATLAASGFFADARDTAKAVAKILAGRELGFAPMASMMGVHVIQGRVAISPMLMAAKVKQSGKYDYRITRLDANGCLLTFTERVDTGQWRVLGTSEFTKEDAFKAGLGTRTSYRTYPRNMYFARAMGNGCRWYCPDIFGGPVYVPEELGATVDDNGAAASLPHVEGPLRPMESIETALRLLDGTPQQVRVRTMAYFGEALMTPEALGDFAVRERERWVEGCALLLDQPAPPADVQRT